jgi:RNA polymerase sigma factor (sigma-70 family)
MSGEASIGSTAHIQRCLDRLRAGDEAARGELIQVSFRRLFQLTRKLARPFPRVKRIEDTDGIFSLAYQRLWTSLEKIVPETVRQFFALAAKQIRWALLDLARQVRRGEDNGAAPGAGALPETLSDGQGEPDQFLAWVELHDQADLLPDELREAFHLLYYFGLTQAEAADVLGISAKTVGRLWRDARLELHRRLQGLWPDL